MSDIRYEQDMCAEAVKSAYEKGLETAWEIMEDIASRNYTDPMLNDIFGDDWYYGGIRTCLKDYTALEVINKIKEYRENSLSKQDPKKPKVGDRVVTLKAVDPFGHKLFPVGTIGEIGNIEKGNLPYIIYNEDHSDFWWYDENMFAVIEEGEE